MFSTSTHSSLICESSSAGLEVLGGTILSCLFSSQVVLLLTFLLRRDEVVLQRGFPSSGFILASFSHLTEKMTISSAPLVSINKSHIAGNNISSFDTTTQDGEKPHDNLIPQELYYWSTTNKDLRSSFKNNRLPQTGKKVDLISGLKDHDSKQPVLTSKMLKVEPTEPPPTPGRKRRRSRNADGEIKVEYAEVQSHLQTPTRVSF